MTKKILIATTNEGKAQEFKAMFERLGYEIETLNDHPEFPEIEETGSSFEENARLKAEGIAEQTGGMVLADDSGLMIDALNGQPGVYSARYAGPEKSDAANRRKVLEEMQGLEKDQRTAHFHTVLVLVAPDKNPLVVEGVLDGYITTEERGENGFGYDSIFFLEDQGRTLAEMTLEEKNAISHRAKATTLLENEWITWENQ